MNTWIDIVLTKANAKKNESQNQLHSLKKSQKQFWGNTFTCEISGGQISVHPHYFVSIQHRLHEVYQHREFMF